VSDYCVIVVIGSPGKPCIGALAVHLMTNTAVIGATYDIYGGQQLLEG
jgi:hypothetical protein